MRESDGVSTDVLGDAAGFTGSDVGFADHIEQRRFAVVNVTHDGDDGRTRLELFRLIVEINFNFLFDPVNCAFTLSAFLNLKLYPVLRTHLDCDLLVNRLIHIGEDASFHEVSDDLERLLLECLSKFANNNRRLDYDDLCIGGQTKSWRCGLCGFSRTAWTTEALLLSSETLAARAALAGAATKLSRIATATLKICLSS